MDVLVIKSQAGMVLASRSERLEHWASSYDTRTPLAKNKTKHLCSPFSFCTYGGLSPNVASEYV